MAKFVPYMCPDEISNLGEQTLAKAFVNHLPDCVEVVHHYRFSSRDNKQHECDFVLLDPRHGLLFVEVKGHKKVHFKNGYWSVCYGGGETRDPFKQVQDNMWSIVHECLGGKTQPFTYHFAVALPHCRLSADAEAPTDMIRGQILDMDAMKGPEGMERWMRESFGAAPIPKPPPTKDVLEEVKNKLFPKFGWIVDMSSIVTNQEKQLKRMTDEQKELVERFKMPLLAIQGVAGSGKTVLALTKAQTAAHAGLRTLFLCYNRPLCDWLCNSQSERFGDNLVIKNYHQLVDNLCKKAGVSQPRPRKRDYWVQGAPCDLMKACEKLGPEHKFDAVVVDEGQDFHKKWWTSLESVFRKPTCQKTYWVFFDPDQNLYGLDPFRPEKFYKLDENCRNTVAIGKHCAKEFGHKHKSKRDMPCGTKPEVIPVSTEDQALKEVKKLVRQLCTPKSHGDHEAVDEGLKPSQVAVLTTPPLKRRTLERFGDSIPATGADDLSKWRESKGILVETVARFKGLEADAIVVIEAKAMKPVERYVASSRAKHLLFVIQVEH